MSILPLVALAIIAAGIVGNPEGVGEELAKILVYYFPASNDLIGEAVRNLLNDSLGIGILALIGIVIGSNGLFMAAHRAVNRIFGTESTNFVQITATQVIITTLIVILFLLSVGLTSFFLAVVNVLSPSAHSWGGLSAIAVVALGSISTVLHVVLTATVFAVVYFHLPSIHVEWRDATFGALIAIFFFEIAKHLFLWYTNIAAKGAVYGPITSFVILMMWAYISGLIFLYGAALVKNAAELRKSTLFPDRR